jgi:hypothetical protein
MLALLVLALSAAAPEPSPYQPASAEECRVIDAAVGSAPATTVAVPPEQIMPPTDPEGPAIFGAGRPPLGRGMPAADISRCLRANRPFDPIPGSDTSLIVSRATIDEAAGRAVVLYDHACGAGGVIELTRDRNGDWIKASAKMLWQHVCDLPPIASPR